MRTGKIVVFGPTGATGREIVSQALAQGHEVTAFARSPAKLAAAGDRWRVVTGSVTEDADKVAQAVRGQDAVISALGRGNSLSSQNLISRSVRVIVAAMHSEGVRRLIFVSAFGVGESRRDAPLLPRIMYRLFLGRLFADKAAADDYLRRSDLDWTLVYPVLLTNGPATGRYRVGERLRLGALPKISRADVAAFILTQLDDTAYLRKTAVVSD